jgi:epoxyqueuosine reductase
VSGKQLRREMDDFLAGLGAFKVGVADPRAGFAQARHGSHPLDVMSECRSVIVYAFNIGLDYYKAIDYEHNNIRLGHLYRDWAGFQLISFMRQKGYEATVVPRDYVDKKRSVARLSFKLAAYEAGIGVFGRPSIIITPEYGPRTNLGVVLTSAVLEPDGRMQDFNPCENCNMCINACPINAIKSDMPPPVGFDREKCVAFIDWLKEYTNDKVKLCGYCFNKCPTGKLLKRTLRIKKWRTLEDLKPADRKKLTDGFRMK